MFTPSVHDVCSAVPHGGWIGQLPPLFALQTPTAFFFLICVDIIPFADVPMHGLLQILSVQQILTPVCKIHSTNLLFNIRIDLMDSIVLTNDLFGFPDFDRSVNGALSRQEDYILSAIYTSS